jgi:hypothetical protein
MTMHWYTWQTKNPGFDTWHTAVKTGLGMPWIGENQATGEPEPDAQQTTDYTAVVEVAADDWRAPVSDLIAGTYPDGLGTPCDPPPEPELP